MDVSINLSVYIFKTMFYKDGPKVLKDNSGKIVADLLWTLVNKAMVPGPEVFMLPYRVPVVGVFSLASWDSNTTQEFWAYGSLNMAESVS